MDERINNGQSETYSLANKSKLNAEGFIDGNGDSVFGVAAVATATKSSHNTRRRRRRHRSKK